MDRLETFRALRTTTRGMITKEFGVPERGSEGELTQEELYREIAYVAGWAVGSALAVWTVRFTRSKSRS